MATKKKTMNKYQAFVEKLPAYESKDLCIKCGDEELNIKVFPTQSFTDRMFMIDEIADMLLVEGVSGDVEYNSDYALGYGFFKYCTDVGTDIDALGLESSDKLIRYSDINNFMKNSFEEFYYEILDAVVNTVDYREARSNSIREIVELFYPILTGVAEKIAGLDEKDIVSAILDNKLASEDSEE